MAELVILSLNRADVIGSSKRADAIKNAELWADDMGKEIACFLCDSQTETPPFTMILPDVKSYHSMMAVPLCRDCGELPRMVRLNRCIKLLRKMWSKNGKQVHFVF